MQRLAPLTSAAPDHPLYYGSVLEQYKRDGYSPEFGLLYCSAHASKAKEALASGDLRLYESCLAAAISNVDRREEGDVRCELYLRLTMFYLQQSTRDRRSEAECLLIHALGLHRKYRDAFHSPDSGVDFLESARPAAFIEQLHLFALQVWAHLNAECRCVRACVRACVHSCVRACTCMRACVPVWRRNARVPEVEHPRLLPAKERSSTFGVFFLFFFFS